MRLFKFLIGASIIATAFGFPAAQRTERSDSDEAILEIDVDLSALKPDQDPFYKPPDGYESAAPGDILRSRQVTTSFLGILPQNLQASYQLLYRTVDHQQQPSATVLTVLVPHHAKEFPEIVSFQNAEDSANFDCAPSVQLAMGGDASNGLVQIELLLMDHVLSDRRIVITSDYEGPLSGFGNGPLAATGVLDGIRAALNFQKIVTDKSKVKIGLNGYSGGALATAWAIQKAPSYAPELEPYFVGAALGGLPVSIKNIFEHLNAGLFAGIAGSGIAGLINTVPELHSYFSPITTNFTSVLGILGASCITDMVSKLAFTNFLTLGGLNMTEIYESKPLGDIMNGFTLGGPKAPVPKMPIYLYHAVLDEVIVPKDIDSWAQDLCDRGIESLEHKRELVGEHITLQLTGSPGAFNFLDRRFKGQPPAKGCKTDDVVTSLLDPLAILTFTDTLLDALKALLSLPIGDLL